MRLHTRPSGRHLLGLGGLGALVLVIAIVVSLTGASWRTQPSASSAAQVTATRLPPTFFGMNLMTAGGGSWPRVSVGAVRLWDSRTAWKELNPAPGTWNWQALDTAVASAEQRRTPVLLVLGQTPTWAASRPAEGGYYFGAGAASMPRDLEAWRTYVRTVAERYRGRIEAYEVWNEANLSGFFTGTPEQMVELTRVARESIKAADPKALVVAPSLIDRHNNAVSWMQRYLAAGGGALVDVFNVHLYPAQTRGPEQKPLLQALRSLLRTYRVSRPIWDTEANYMFNQRILDDATAVAFVARTYLWSAGQGLSRVYWYAWEMQHPAVAIRMTRPDLATLTPAARAFASVQSWIGGWQPAGCRVDAAGSWTCVFAKGLSRRTAMWKPSRRASVPAPVWARTYTRLGAAGRAHPERPVGAGGRHARPRHVVDRRSGTSVAQPIEVPEQNEE